MTLLDDGPDVGEEMDPACAYDRLLPGARRGRAAPQRVAGRHCSGSTTGPVGRRQRRPVLGRRGDVARDRGGPGGRACVQSPMKKQAFALDDGTCLDAENVSIPVYGTGSE